MTTDERSAAPEVSVCEETDPDLVWLLSNARALGIFRWYDERPEHETDGKSVWIEQVVAVRERRSSYPGAPENVYVAAAQEWPSGSFWTYRVLEVTPLRNPSLTFAGEDDDVLVVRLEHEGPEGGRRTVRVPVYPEHPGVRRKIGRGLHVVDAPYDSPAHLLSEFRFHSLLAELIEMDDEFWADDHPEATLADLLTLRVYDGPLEPGTGEPAERPRPYLAVSQGWGEARRERVFRLDARTERFGVYDYQREAADRVSFRLDCKMEERDPRRPKHGRELEFRVRVGPEGVEIAPEVRP